VPNRYHWVRWYRSLIVLSLLIGSVATATTPGWAAEEIQTEGVVHGGMYPKDHWNGAAELDAMSAWAGKRVTFMGLFHQVRESIDGWDGNTDHLLEEAWQAQATPFSNVAVNASAASIAAGNHDGDINAWAAKVQAWLGKGGGRSVIIAPLQEMNGNWTPYGVDPANFKIAYRRIRQIFLDRGMGETQVRWAFAPNGWSTPPYKIADYHPGDDVVDVIGISAYNWGSAIQRWESPAQMLDGALGELRAFAPGKPYLIAQTASSSTGGDKDAWLRDLFSYSAADPNVFGLVYFNIDKETDWAVWYGTGSPGNRIGWKDGLNFASTHYQWPLTNWFQPGPLPFKVDSGLPPCPAGVVCDSVALVDSGSQFHLYDRVEAGSGVSRFYYGVPGDVPLMGDWDCDGVSTPAMYRPTNGFMYLRNSNTQGVADRDYFYGNPSDLPIAGDFDGDGCDTLAIYRRTEGQVYVKNSLGTGVADYSFYFGNPGDKPFTGDFDGDGVDTVGLHRESTGFVYFRNSNSQGVADFEFFYGNPGDKLVAGDWDRNGTDTLAVYRPSTGQFYVKLHNSQGVADYTLAVGSFVASTVAGR